MSLNNPNIFHAACGVTGDAVAPVYNRQRGFTGAIVRNGAGDYTLTLSEAVDALESEVFVTQEANLAASQLNGFGIVRTDTTIRITMLREGGGGAVSALTDMDIQVLVMRLPTNN